MIAWYTLVNTTPMMYFSRYRSPRPFSITYVTINRHFCRFTRSVTGLFMQNPITNHPVDVEKKPQASKPTELHLLLKWLGLWNVLYNQDVKRYFICGWDFCAIGKLLSFAYFFRLKIYLKKYNIIALQRQYHNALTGPVIDLFSNPYIWYQASMP